MTRATAVLLVVLSLASAACGGASAAAPPASAPVDACALLTLQDVTEATGRKDFGRGKSKDDGATCFYSSSRGSVTVSTDAAQLRQDFDDFRKLLVDQGKTVEDVSGVGDAAYFWDDLLYVHVGTRGLSVRVNANELAPAAPGATRPAVLALARKGADRLR